MTERSPVVNVQHIAPGLEIRFEQETQMVETMLGVKKPDKDWRFVDKQGHIHAWIDDQLPSLGKHVTGKTWVGDDHDGYEIDVTEYRCLVCLAVVEPKYTTSYEPQFVKGPPRYYLMIRAGIQDREMPVPDDDVPELIAILGRMFGRDSDG